MSSGHGLLRAQQRGRGRHGKKDASSIEYPHGLLSASTHHEACPCRSCIRNAVFGGKPGKPSAMAGTLFAMNGSFAIVARVARFDKAYAPSHPAKWGGMSGLGAHSARSADAGPRSCQSVWPLHAAFLPGRCARLRVSPLRNRSDNPWRDDWFVPSFLRLSSRVSAQLRRGNRQQTHRPEQAGRQERRVGSIRCEAGEGVLLERPWLLVADQPVHP